MSHLLADITPIARKDIATSIREKIEETRNSRTRSSEIVRISVRVEDAHRLPLLHWLSAQSTKSLAGEPKFYWSDRDRHRETAAIGAADCISAPGPADLPALFDQLESGLHDQPDTVRYFGGFRFDLTSEHSKSVDSPWRNFPAAKFVLPRFELVRYDDSLLFACNLRDQDWQTRALDHIIASLENLNFSNPSTEPEEPSMIERQDTPNRDSWQDILESADSLLQRGVLRKIVLARRSSLSFHRPLSPWTLLEQLRSSSDGCYLFGMQPGDGATFIGSSPERLYQREGIRLQTEALAGTRPRGGSHLQDTQLAEELRTSEKDAREHRIVVDGITEALQQLGVRHKHDVNPTLLSLSQVHHLACRIIGKLNETTTDRDLVMALHPTPAVGGYPGGRAVQEIGALEPFDRGWYAGPIGWLGRDSAELAVGIRSALVDGSRLHLFAGAGIVPGSDPESEWQEVETKISRFISLVAGSE